MIEHYDIRIYGQVQGVSFRWAATRTAANLGIMGFVRNESDGSVYIEAEGEKEDLEKFLEWCNKGPDYAIVENMIATPSELKHYKSFDVRY